MVDKAGRNLLQREIDHRVRTYDHRIRPCFELCNNAAKDAVIDVKVVGIELDRVLPAVFRVNRFVPASADSQVLASRNGVSDADR
jgi:hypothetical protein